MISVKEAKEFGNTIREEEKELAAKLEADIDRQIRDQMGPFTSAVDIVLPATVPARAQLFLQSRYKDAGWYISATSSSRTEVRWTFCTAAPTWGDRD